VRRSLLVPVTLGSERFGEEHAVALVLTDAVIVATTMHRRAYRGYEVAQVGDVVTVYVGTGLHEIVARARVVEGTIRSGWWRYTLDVIDWEDGAICVVERHTTNPSELI
jgi:hypothetical protein